jgi:hypothetical protein
MLTSKTAMNDVLSRSIVCGPFSLISSTRRKQRRDGEQRASLEARLDTAVGVGRLTADENRAETI